MVVEKNRTPFRTPAFIALVFWLSTLAQAQNFDPREQAMIDRIDAHQEEAIALRRPLSTLAAVR